MANVSFVETAGQLVLVKNRAIGLLRNGMITLLGLVSILIGIFAIASIGIYSGTLLVGGALALLVGAGETWQFLTKGESLILDHQSDSISENGTPVCKLSELKGIEV